MSVVIETTIGDVTVDLYLNERPKTCLNFLKLCKRKYYNLCVFHKLERNFISQTGDPTSTGRGGESIFCHLYGEQAKYFDAELKPRLKHEKLGTLSMVNNGNNMNGSQFFFTLGENLAYLDEIHTVFGEVVEGFDILSKMNEAICDQNNRPYQDIRISHTVVLHDPYDDPAGLEIPDGSPIPTKEQLESNYIGADEEIDDTKGKSVEEVEEKIKESEAKARATILEMVGDLPDVDVKPPENVLFVCKLNPVTTSEDLEIIFSRFGKIVSCEVIKDKKSGESLQYAFIEFEKEEDCENAYFKMDNVLIDDRRIHVDFSQSVSKLNWEEENKFSKGKGSSRNQNFIVKGSGKKSDGYEMIFDLNDNSNSNKDKAKYKAYLDEKYRHKKNITEKRHISSNKKFQTHSEALRCNKRPELKDDFRYCSSSTRPKETTPKKRSKYNSESSDQSDSDQSIPTPHPKKIYKHKHHDSGSSNVSDGVNVSGKSHAPKLALPVKNSYHRKPKKNTSNRHIHQKHKTSSTTLEYKVSEMHNYEKSSTSSSSSQSNSPVRLETKHASFTSQFRHTKSPKTTPYMQKEKASHRLNRSRSPVVSSSHQRKNKPHLSRHQSPSPEVALKHKMEMPKQRSSEASHGKKKKLHLASKSQSSSPEISSKHKQKASKQRLSRSPETVYVRKNKSNFSRSRSSSSDISLKQRKFSQKQRSSMFSKTYEKNNKPKLIRPRSSSSEISLRHSRDRKRMLQLQLPRSTEPSNHRKNKPISLGSRSLNASTDYHKVKSKHYKSSSSQEQSPVQSFDDCKDHQKSSKKHEKKHSLKGKKHHKRSSS